MAHQMDLQAVKEKAIELTYAIRAIIRELAAKDRTPEGLKAGEVIEDIITKAAANGFGIESKHVNGQRKVDLEEANK